MKSLVQYINEAKDSNYEFIRLASKSVEGFSELIDKVKSVAGSSIYVENVDDGIKIKVSKGQDTSSVISVLQAFVDGYDKEESIDFIKSAIEKMTELKDTEVEEKKEEE